MTYPLWLINSGVTLLSLFTLLGLWLTKPTVKPFRVMHISEAPAIPIQESSAINIEEIYKKDLFGTYIEPEPKKRPAFAVEQVPSPPQPRPVKIPTQVEPNFVEPLSVMLKGIIYVSGNEGKSRAILQDTATQQEQIYRVGNKIIDGELIRIFENKILILRANGQQETLYLREQDSRLDGALAILTGWSDVITQINDTEYTVDPVEFVRRISSLAQFIDQMDLTTVFRQGKAIGTRIGSVGPTSAAVALGFMQGDVILSVNDIPATDTQERVKIYNIVVSDPGKSSFEVQLMRNNTIEKYKYTVVEPEQNNTDSPPDPEIEETKVEAETVELSAVLQKLKQKERAQTQAFYAQSKYRNNGT